MSYQKTEKCHSCHETLSDKSVFTLGLIPVVEFPETPEGRGIVAPLYLTECPSCKLVQLQHTVDADLLFRDFWYKSGITGSMKHALQDVHDAVVREVNPQLGDAVLDIGSNDGTLLDMFPVMLLRVGFEPAENLATEARDKGLVIVPEYFTREHVYPDWHGRFKAVTAISMFYDLSNPGEFLETVKLVMHPEGVFIVQMNYLGTMLRDLDVGNIVHEHLAYYSIQAFHKLVVRHGMVLTGVELNDVNGGSVRFTVRLGGETPASITEAINKESLKPWPEFTAGLINMRGAVLMGLTKAEMQKKRIAICGASTRGLALLHFLGRGKDTFAVAGERDPGKWGRFYGATGIPIVSEAEAREKADVMLVLPWHFAQEITEREHAWIEAGGELIFPLPEPRIVRRTGTEKL